MKKLSITMKTLLLRAAVLTLAAIIYYWGHSDGRSGTSIPHLIGTAYAQDAAGDPKNAKGITPRI